MTDEQEHELKLFLWRDSTSEHTMTSWVPEHIDSHTNTPVGGQHSNVFKQIYSITLREDFRNCITDPELRSELGDLLYKLDLSLPPPSRQLIEIGKFITKADEALQSDMTEVSSIQASPESDEITPRYVNSLLALKLHLKWLSRCFGDHPGISVSIR